jgi:hypothetical protein
MSESASPGVVRFVESGILGADPVPWLLASSEPYAVWVALRELTDSGEGAVADAHAAVLSDPDFERLVEDLPRWGESDFPGHHSPQFLPNRLNLLADMGVGAGDDARIENLLDEMLSHQASDGRFLSFGRYPSTAEPEWGSLPCDTNAITDVLQRFGRADDPRVARAFARMVADAAATPQGRAWQCVSEAGSKFRGPGRRADACPQVTLEGLRAISHLDPSDRPRWVLEAARTSLEVWRRRTEERPYMFGHGFQFKSVKWPNFWYDLLWVLETVGRYPGLWRGSTARAEDRLALAEMAACLVAYNFEDDHVTPRRTYKGFERYSFGQKAKPSPFATARSLVALARLADLADEIAAVDVLSLPSSKGGTGSPLPPKGGEESPATCITPAPRPYALERVLPRILQRQHLDVSWEPASIESVVADVVALHATHMASAYVSLQARLPGFTKGVLEDSLYSRRSLVRFRGMRGALYLVRRDLLPVVWGATNRAVVRYARRLAEDRGLTPEAYEAQSARVLCALQDAPLSSRELRARVDDRAGPPVDLGAVLTLMSAECLILRDRPPLGWLDRQTVWTTFSAALPNVRLDTLDELDARARLLVAYVRAFGPATARDAAWWTGISPDHVRRTVDRLEDELVEVAIAGWDEVYLMHAADVEELERATLLANPAVSLLPALDPLLMGYANRARLLGDSARPYVFDASGNATSTVVAEGRVVGVWEAAQARRDPTHAEARVLVHLFEPQPPRTQDAIEARAAALGRFWFDAEVPVVFEPRMTPLAERPAGSFVHPLGT